ncbi:hypothetical protein [Methanohalophilus sp.]|uniref:hypothetical protein n=1 Tax=Methanohalophilus sp. TaxID=1966352 RepID=UPI0026375D8B|nr:hypothetical protein [Methanohalophilus sp.]MDK2891926.1 hypothetical protein [Methanohalophilus sp.]
MKEILKLENKFRKMNAQELYEYATQHYPEIPNVGIGKPKLVIRRLLNLERERLYREEK